MLNETLSLERKLELVMEAVLGFKQFGFRHRPFCRALQSNWISMLQVLYCGWGKVGVFRG